MLKKIPSKEDSQKNSMKIHVNGDSFIAKHFQEEDVTLYNIIRRK
jgi:hypothetical protein